MYTADSYRGKVGHHKPQRVRTHGDLLRTLQRQGKPLKILQKNRSNKTEKRQRTSQRKG